MGAQHQSRSLTGLSGCTVVGRGAAGPAVELGMTVERIEEAWVRGATEQTRSRNFVRLTVDGTNGEH